MNRKRPISPDFYNSEINAPFESCMVCNQHLLDGSIDYFVERIFRRVPEFGITEALFEYAMCINCAHQMKDDMSKESMRKIEEFFIKHMRHRSDEKDFAPLANCLLTGKPIDNCSEFSYHAHCRGGEMLQSIFPYAVSNEAMDKISALLSAETTDELDKFKGKYFTGPPEVANLLNPKRLVPL